MVHAAVVRAVLHQRALAEDADARDQRVRPARQNEGQHAARLGQAEADFQRAHVQVPALALQFDSCDLRGVGRIARRPRGVEPTLPALLDVLAGGSQLVAERLQDLVVALTGHEEFGHASFHLRKIFCLPDDSVSSPPRCAGCAPARR